MRTVEKNNQLKCGNKTSLTFIGNLDNILILILYIYIYIYIYIYMNSRSGQLNTQQPCWRLCGDREVNNVFWSCTNRKPFRDNVNAGMQTTRFSVSY